MEAKEKMTKLPREGGWFYTEDGAARLREGGKRGHDDCERKIEEQIGQRHRVRAPLTKQAADIVKSVKGFIPRALFVSGAIMREAQRRARIEGVKGGE